MLKTIPHASLAEEGWQSDVVIVDGKSTDSSQQVGAEGGCVVLVQPSKGKGEAVRLGFTYALQHHYDAVIMFDADQTYNPVDMLRMLAKLESGMVVVGNRLNRHLASDAMSPVNWIGNHLLTWSAVILHGLEIDDVCSGFWLFDREALLQMNLNSMNFEIEAEMYAQCAITGIRSPTFQYPTAPELARQSWFSTRRFIDSKKTPRTQIVSPSRRGGIGSRKISV